MKVVIVDDESDICFILGLELKAAGFNCVSFESAFAAQKYFETETADAIICDFLMPKMSGLDFFNWLRSAGKNIPFVILTGEPMMDTKQLLSSGITEVLFKPQDLKKIPITLNKICSAQKV
jgi:DNA-binding response OmpR family regulator